jgi:hypothetical protein
LKPFAGIVESDDSPRFRRRIPVEIRVSISAA